MNILIVDGNEKEASLRYTDMGMDTQYEVYKNVINSLASEDLNIQIIHPAISHNFLPDGVIKKPSLYLADTFPDLNADSFLLLSILENLIISNLKVFI